MREHIMTTDLTVLPAPIRAYLDARDSRDDEAAVRAFAADATVTDEGRTYTGTHAIHAWRRRTSTAYTYTTEVTDIRQDTGGVWVVAVRLEGNFPGGTADLRLRFTTRDGTIADLTID
jgi:hypothetical protein